MHVYYTDPHHFFLWALDLSHDHTSSYYPCLPKVQYYPLDVLYIHIIYIKIHYIYMIHLSYISYIIYTHLIQTFNLVTQIVWTHNQWNNIKIALGKEKFWSWYLVMDKFGCLKANSGSLHWQEDSLAYTMLITALYLTWSKGHCKP